MSRPRLSVVIRNRNESAALRHLFAALRTQTLQDHELVLVDNDSEDESRSLAEAAGARIVKISRERFTYGRSINLGMTAASAENVVLLSAHSIPLQKDFLEIVNAYLEQPMVAGVRCVQATRREEVPNWHELIRLDKSADPTRILQWGLNATCCGIRRMVWESVPFDETIEAAEDKLWTRDVLRRGWEVWRVPAMYGYIKTTSRERGVERNYREALGAYRAFGIKPRYTLLGPISAMTVGGFRRYWNDVRLTWKQYLLLRSVVRAARSAAKEGSLW
jgi:rhamnosyltransferase